MSVIQQREGEVDCGHDELTQEDSGEALPSQQTWPTPRESGPGGIWWER